jgi:hypothetical protein
VVNRMTPAIPDSAELKRAKVSAALRRKLVRNAKDFAALKDREARALGKLLSGVGATMRVLCVPELGREPRSVADLAELARRVEVLKT